MVLASEYDAAGVVRVFPDGLSPSHVDAFRMTMTELRFSGGKVNGQLQGESGTAVRVSGTFDPKSGELQFDLVSSTITSTRTEAVAIGGVGEEALPRDGVADQLTGFARAEIDLVVREGQFLAVSRYDGRPPAIDASMLTATAASAEGTVLVEGAAGAAVPEVGVEIFRFTRDRPDPDINVVESMPDGSFANEMTGLAGDVFLVRNAPAGRVGVAAAVVAQ